MLKISAANKKYDDMHKYLVQILYSIKFNISYDEQGKIDPNEEIPSYIINAFVYYYLLINRRDLALYILKKRRVKEILPPIGRE